MEEEKITGLPENAHRELKEGEEYKPILPAEKVFPEVNFRSVSTGLLMAVLFSAAAAYLGLKVGQVLKRLFIAIIAVGLSSAAKRKNVLGENVIIQSIGASSGVIVAGAIFTLPALYILQAKYPDIWQILYRFFSVAAGWCVGNTFLIPFVNTLFRYARQVSFSGSNTTTQVLVSVKKVEIRKPLIIAGIIGGLYDFIVATFGAWAEVFFPYFTFW